MHYSRRVPAPVHLPVLRLGVEYESLERLELKSHRDGEPLALVSQANAGMVRRDLLKASAGSDPLRDVPCARLLEMCAEAAAHFMSATLPLNEAGETQSPEQYVAALSASSGLPHTLCRANMEKVATVLREMPGILRGLTRGMDLEVIDSGFAEQGGVPVCYARTADALGVVLPSNSPGVNSIWMPAIALKTPVVLKPGSEEPWTPLRIVRALIAAGVPRAAFGFYPTDHEGAAAILDLCGRSLLFGDDRTTAPHAASPAIQVHGPGRSKVLVGADQIERWPEFLDVLADSVATNGGRSCINASTVIVPAHADALADALAKGLAALRPRDHDDEAAALSAFADPRAAQAIDAAIERGLAAGGAEDVSARYRAGPRLVQHDGGAYLLPTVVRCNSIDHPLANTEYLFAFTSVVEMPQDEMISRIGPSLVVSAITKDPALRAALVASPAIDRLNLGPIPTSRVEWDQPHEGNLFEFLYRRRAIQRDETW